MAKQFTSWSTHGIESHSERVEKARRAEKLIERQEKLKDLLMAEQEHYKRELEENKKTKKQSQESCSLEELRQKLLEKKAEESLYYPNTARRMRSYEFSPTHSAKQLESMSIIDEPDHSAVDTHSRQQGGYTTSANVIGGNSVGPHCESPTHEIEQHTGYFTSANVIGGKSIGPLNESPAHDIHQKSGYFTSANVIGGKSVGQHNESPAHDIQQQTGYSTSANVIGGKSIGQHNESPAHDIHQKTGYFTSANVIGGKSIGPHCESTHEIEQQTGYSTSGNVIGGKSVGPLNESPAHDIQQQTGYLTSANVIGGKSAGQHNESPTHDIQQQTGYFTSANVIGGKSIGQHNESPAHDIHQKTGYFTSANVIGGQSVGPHCESTHEIEQQTGYSTSGNVIGGKSVGPHCDSPTHEIVQQTGYSTSANVIGGKSVGPHSESPKSSKPPSSRYVQQSLQDTNIRGEDAIDQSSKPGSDCDAEDPDYQNGEEQNFQVTREKRSVSDLEMKENQRQRSASLSGNQPILHAEEHQTSYGDDFDVNYYRRGNMQQKEADFGDTDMSVQMYRYMKHNDLKHKILDISKREQSFVTKQRWDEALRLREMRNELIRLRNKNLYENEDLIIDEEIRKAGREIIKAREELNEKRAKMSDSLMYSDEAKDLWNKWVKEDSHLDATESAAMRDLRLNEVEEEWKKLALIDKHRISQLYDRVLNKSDLQEEHHLISIIEKANSRQKQYMNYLVT